MRLISLKPSKRKEDFLGKVFVKIDKKSEI